MPKRCSNNNNNNESETVCPLSALITTMIHDILTRKLSHCEEIVDLRAGWNAYLRINVIDRHKDVVVEYSSGRLSLSSRFLCKITSVCEPVSPVIEDDKYNYFGHVYHTNPYLSRQLKLWVDFDDDYDANFQMELASCTIPALDPTEFVKLPDDFVFAYRTAINMRRCKDCNHIRSNGICSHCLLRGKHFMLVQCSACQEHRLIYNNPNCQKFICSYCEDCPSCAN